MTELCAEKLRKDPRVAEAKKLILEAVSEHQQGLTEVRAAASDRKADYDALIEDFGKTRPGKLWYPYVGSGIGNGPFVELEDGSVKYDFICGIGVHQMGHSNPEFISASIDAACSDTVMQGHLQQNRESYELCKLFTQSSGMDRCFLSSSGAMANENAWKIIFQKRQPAQRVLAFDHCFMGRTLGMAQVTDKAGNRVGLPSTIPVDYIPFFDHSDPQGSTERALEALHTHIRRYPGQHAGIAFEPVQGEAGFIPGNRDFFVKVFEYCKEHGILVFADEVQTFGRTHSLYAYHHFGLQDYVDVVTVGKMSQICCTLFNNELMPGPGLLSQTYTSSTTAIQSAISLIRHLQEGDYFGPDGKNARMNAYCAKALDAIAERHPGMVSGPYGIGGMVAFTAFDGNPKRTGAITQALFDAGVICFVAGSNPMRIRFLLPVPVITETHVDGAMAIIEEVLVQHQEVTA